MSIVESLRRLVDPGAHRHDQLRRKTEREQPEQEAAGGPDEPDEPAVAKEQLYRCRVCGHVGDDRSYCPSCLADTMRKV